MAAPVVSGAAALMLQANPNLTPDTIKAWLMFGADKWADPQSYGDPCIYGAGYLNIPAALHSTVIATKPALSPSLSLDANGNVIINMDGTLWGTRALWGTCAIWGKNVWGDRAIWGVSTSQADLSTKVIRGEN